MRPFALVSLVLLASSLNSLGASAEDHRPSIILIVVEDLSPRIGPYGDEVAETPNLDALAADGLVFKNVFTAAGVCAPSRAALITGMYPQSIGAQHMRTSSFGRTRTGPQGTFGTDGNPYEVVPPPDVKAFPELLRRLGYFTFNKSKTDYQIGRPFSVWTRSGRDAKLNELPTDRPFLAMFSNSTTHESKLFQPGVATATEGGPERAERAERDLADLVHRTDPRSVVVPSYLPDTEAVRIEVARHYDNIRLMDRWTGELLSELEVHGLLENALIIWTTDHGDGFPRAKRSLYDSGLKVPMIMAGPHEILSNFDPDALVSFVDIAPTLVVLAGGEPATFHQGYDLTDEEGLDRSAVFAARGRLDEHPDRSRSIRTKKYKLITNEVSDRPLLAPLGFRENLASMQELRRLKRNGRLPDTLAEMFATPRAPVELYDIEKDPWELNNLANSADYALVRDNLLTRLQAWQRRSGSLGTIPEKRLVEGYFWPGGVQPVTSPPIVTKNTEADQLLISLSSLTGGASIGYRRVDSDPEWLWRLYREPFVIDPHERVVAKAIRYGFEESAEILIGGRGPEQMGAQE